MSEQSEQSERKEIKFTLIHLDDKYDEECNCCTVGNRKYKQGDDFIYDGKESIIGWFKVEITDAEFTPGLNDILIDDDEKTKYYSALIGYEYTPEQIYQILESPEHTEEISGVYHYSNENKLEKLNNFSIGNFHTS